MIKNIFLFFGGIVFAVVLLVVIGRANVNNDQVLGVSAVNVQEIETMVKNKVQQEEKEGIVLVKEGIFPKIIAAIVENPLLAPFIKTQKKVSEAVIMVKDLPGDQKEAICNQICP